MNTTSGATFQESTTSRKDVFYYSAVILQALIYIPTFLLFSLLARFSVKGLENLQNLQPGIIFAANHSSEWDGVLLRVALPFFSRRFSPMYYVSMRKNEYRASGWRNYIYGGNLFKLLGAYPRYSGKKDYAYALQHHIAILKNGGNVCIFPEGKRTMDGSLGTAHGGVAFLAHATGRPVVPVGISGLVKFSFTELLMGRRRVSVNFGKIIQLPPHSAPSPELCKTESAAILEEIKKLVVTT